MHVFLFHVKGPTNQIYKTLCDYRKVVHTRLSSSGICWYRHKLGGKQAHHMMHWIHRPAASDVAWLTAEGLEISGALCTVCVERTSTNFYW